MLTRSQSDFECRGLGSSPAETAIAIQTIPNRKKRHELQTSKYKQSTTGHDESTCSQISYGVGRESGRRYPRGMDHRQDMPAAISPPEARRGLRSVRRVPGGLTAEIQNAALRLLCSVLQEFSYE
jgi:hypothetical protein